MLFRSEPAKRCFYVCPHKTAKHSNCRRRRSDNGDVPVWWGRRSDDEQCHEIIDGRGGKFFAIRAQRTQLGPLPVFQSRLHAVREFLLEHRAAFLPSFALAHATLSFNTRGPPPRPAQTLSRLARQSAV